MPVDRIDKTDPTLYRVEQAADQRRRGRDDQSQQKERDKFEKKPSVWRRILSMSPGRTSSLLTGRPQGLPIHRNLPDEPEESLTLSERLLVAWGVIHRDGRPRPGVILTYVLVVGMILGATLLIIGMSVWQ